MQVKRNGLTGEVISVVPVYAAFHSEGEEKILLTQKNLLTNFVWDEVTENCKFSHAAETQPA